MAITIFYAIDTLIGEVAIVAAVTEMKIGVAAEGQSLEKISKPLSARG